MSEDSIIRISRRQFLFGAGAITLLGVLYTGYRQLGEYPENTLNLRHLSDKEVVIYRILGNWILPAGGPLPGSGGDDECLRRIDAIFDNIPEGKRTLLSALPLAFEHGTLLDHLGSTCLSQLSAEVATSYLDDWATSQNLIRCQLMAALKAMYGFSYFERDDVLTAMNIPPLCAVRS